MMAVLEDCLKLMREHWREEIDLAVCRPTIPRLPTLCKGRHHRYVPGGEPRADGVAAALEAGELLRPRGGGGASSVPDLSSARWSIRIWRAAQGREAVDACIPSLEPVLARTLGVPLFQEQLLNMAMVAAGFTGGEAEELRRAMGFKRSEKRMDEIEAKLRAGMARNGITGETQDRIVQSITSFALYGFPESHAASFALIAYASAYLKCHYLAAFTCAMLNNQPMGFYPPRSSSKMRSATACACCRWISTARIGTARVEARHAATAPGSALCARPARGGWPGHCRGATVLAMSTIWRSASRSCARTSSKCWPSVGALASSDRASPRRAVEGRTRRADPSGRCSKSPGDVTAAPLRPMTTKNASRPITRARPDRRPHPMAYLPRGDEQPRRHPRQRSAQGSDRRVGARGRMRDRAPAAGTAKGIVFLSIEDETGIANAVVMPDMFAENRLTLVTESYLLVEGPVQNVDNVIHVLAPASNASIR